MQKSEVECCKKYDIMILKYKKSDKNEILNLNKFHMGADYEKRIFNE